ncbi:MAG: undecaprenyl/decaprenyl-phosphate alpha-N-acetylglucosaminyl 1-phosphate transferase [Cytophagia bacterium]|nr:undecaprenyl/decaprenyl-phosphate alpha-N-acetylglucosaminyl 1-phosphate transferase [Cytophagia bacterium]NBW34959.1 undecaprenyl/decaprenyl-phosphate alpha-N-acetylglucosaminyl 1-phosphate transferase [Cytophagia bacterium]
MLAYLILYAVISFTIAVLAFPVLIKLLYKWKLFDSPGLHKIHSSFKPSMGGICIMLGVAFTLLISFPLTQWIAMKYFFVALAVIFITGLRDDILTLTPLQKLLGQLLPIIILVVFNEAYLQSFYEMNDSLWPLWLRWIVTVFTLIILTNAYNLIDGLDGLAGTVALVILSVFGAWFFLTDNFYLSVLAFAFAGAIIGFLLFNWQPSKIFMGDTGTLAIGFVISYLAINFINKNYTHDQSSTFHFTASISTCICILIIPVFDTARVIILRLRRGQSPFKADKNHIHHQFLKLGFSHAKTTLFMGGINIFFVGLALLLRNQSDLVILPIIIILLLGINQLLRMAQKNIRVHGK